VYSGDDEMFQFLYRFMSAKPVHPTDRAANKHLLDDGTLYAARFDEHRLTWLPLVYGRGPLTRKNGFFSQADVVIEARRAAELMGATPMDRPEDVETSPVTGKVYVSLTNNKKRTEPNPANPRVANPHGHVLELTPPVVAGVTDHGAERYDWDFFLLGGNPKDRTHSARAHPDVARQGWLSCPDNLAFDPKGRIWIATDGMSKVGVSDALYATDCEGPGRALTKRFFAVPRGAEVTGPSFTPDGTTLFVSVQHPGDEEGSTFLAPSTRWPDFRDDMPPRPAVVAIRRKDGGAIGS
jgi:secreted PhoX family phosphatase